MDDKGKDIAGKQPAAISSDAMPDSGVSARTPAHLSPAVDDHDTTETRGQFRPSSASRRAQQLPGRMWVIVGAGLITWIVIGVVAFLFFF